MNVPSPSLNRFNTDWFTFDDGYGKLKLGKLKSEYADAFYEARDKMYEDQMAACAQAREKLVDLDGLTQEQIEHLSSTYDPKNMSYEEYRSFLDDLCEYGYFAEEDKPLVNCGVGDSNDVVLIPVSYFPQSRLTLSAVPVTPGYTSSFPFNDGNVLAWTKYMSTFGTFNPSSGDFEKTTEALLFDKLQDILLRM